MCLVMRLDVSVHLDEQLSYVAELARGKLQLLRWCYSTAAHAQLWNDGCLLARPDFFGVDLPKTELGLLGSV